MKYIGPAYVTINGHRETVECYEAECAKCKKVRAFAGWDLSKLASAACFYCTTLNKEPSRVGAK